MVDSLLLAYEGARVELVRLPALDVTSGGKLDRLGFDAGARDMPGLLCDPRDGDDDGEAVPIECLGLTLASPSSRAVLSVIVCAAQFAVYLSLKVCYAIPEAESVLIASEYPRRLQSQDAMARAGIIKVSGQRFVKK